MGRKRGHSLEGKGTNHRESHLIPKLYSDKLHENNFDCLFTSLFCVFLSDNFIQSFVTYLSLHALYIHIPLA